MSEQAMTAAPAAAAPKKPIETVRDMLMKMEGQLKMALPRHMTADRMIRVTLTACQKTPKLLECAPVTLLGAVVQCAQLGLEPNDGTGKAYLIPFRNNKKNRDEVQMIVGYKGFIQLARNSGEISSIQAQAVFEKDQFDYTLGTEAHIKHIPPKSGDRGKLTHVYAVARFKDGSEQFEVMSVADVEKIRSRSKSANNGPWVTDFDEMAKKTVIRRLSKTLPASPELHRAVTLDEKADRALAQDLGQIIDTTEVPTPEGEEAAGEEDMMPKRITEATAPAAAPASANAADAPTQAQPATGGAEEVTVGLTAAREGKKKGTYEIVDAEGVVYETQNNIFALTARTALTNKKLVRIAFLKEGKVNIIGKIEAVENK